MNTPTLELVGTLDVLQEIIGDGNAKRGFHSEGDMLRARVEERSDKDNPLCSQNSDHICGDCKMRLSALRNYYMTKVGLIVTEAAEAIEELRNGHSADEQYFSGGTRFKFKDGKSILRPDEPTDHKGNARKPEGVPSEIADIVIRAFDFASEAGFSLGDVIMNKLAFNGTRPAMHGGKAV